MKRLRNGGEDSPYVYGRFAAGEPEEGWDNIQQILRLGEWGDSIGGHL